MSKKVDSFPQYDNYTLDDINDEIKKLDQNIVQFAKDGLYEEADQANNVVDFLKRRLVEKKKELFNNELKLELEELNKAFEELKVKFNSLWTVEMSKFEVDALKQIAALEKRHETELSDVSQRLEKEKELFPKFSTEVANLRKYERLLAVQKKFQEAQRAKLSADALQLQEVEKFRKEEEIRIASLKQQLKEKQEKEKQVLLKRLEREKKELNAQRAADFAKLEQRNSNLSRDQIAFQKDRVLRFEKEALAPPKNIQLAVDPYAAPEISPSLIATANQISTPSTGRTGKFTPGKTPNSTGISSRTSGKTSISAKRPSMPNTASTPKNKSVGKN